VAGGESREQVSVYFAPQPAMMTGNLKEARALMEEGVALLPEEPMIVSLQGVLFALTGRKEKALDCLNKACAIPKTFGHAHHSYYQMRAFFRCWGGGRRGSSAGAKRGDGIRLLALFLKDPWIKNLRELPTFEVLVSSLQAKYPDHLGLL